MSKWRHALACQFSDGNLTSLVIASIRIEFSLLFDVGWCRIALIWRSVELRTPLGCHDRENNRDGDCLRCNDGLESICHNSLPDTEQMLQEIYVIPS